MIEREPTLFQGAIPYEKNETSSHLCRLVELQCFQRRCMRFHATFFGPHRHLASYFQQWL